MPGTPVRYAGRKGYCRENTILAKCRNNVVDSDGALGNVRRQDARVGTTSRNLRVPWRLARVRCRNLLRRRTPGAKHRAQARSGRRESTHEQSCQYDYRDGRFRARAHVYLSMRAPTPKMQPAKNGCGGRICRSSLLPKPDSAPRNRPEQNPSGPISQAKRELCFFRIPGEATEGPPPPPA